MPTMHSVIVVALLPIPIKNHNIHQRWLDEQKQTNRDVPKAVLQRVLQPLTTKQNPSPDSVYYNVLCADGNFRHCKPVSAALLEGCPEYSDQHHPKWFVCFWCECPKNEPGDYMRLDNEQPRRDHILYQMLSDADPMTANAELLSCHIHQGFNVFRHIFCIVSDLPKPDLLHTMQIGMLDHLQNWILHFMKTHERLNKHKAIWLSVPAYHDLTPENKSYEEVSQRNGTEMKEMSRYLLGVVTESLQGGCPTRCPTFNHTIECTWALLEFYMYARYISHNDATSRYMEDT